TRLWRLSRHARSDVPRSFPQSAGTAPSVHPLGATELAKHTKDANVGLRKLARQVRADFLGIDLAKRIDHQAGPDLLVAAAQFFFHRDWLTRRINRVPDFARRDGSILHQISLVSAAESGASLTKRAVTTNAPRKPPSRSVRRHRVRLALTKTSDMTLRVIGVGLSSRSRYGFDIRMSGDSTR